MSVSILAVRLAARILPSDMRERYREQWLADLRDAEEAGLRPTEIAIGSLAFAATLARPISDRVRLPREVTAERRARLASALALSCAVLSLSMFANVGGGWEGLTGNNIYDFLAFLTTGLLFLFFALALVVPLLLVAVTREMAWAVRIAVVLLVLAGLSPFTHSAIYGAITESADANIYLVPGLAFGAGLALALVAGGLLARYFYRRRGSSRSGRQPRVAAASLGVSLLVVAGGIASLLSYRSALRDSDAAFAERWYQEDPGLLGRIAEMHAFSDQATAEAIAVWLSCALGATFVIGASGFIWPRLIVVRTTALILVIAISLAGVQDFVSLFYSGSATGLPEGLLLFVGRWGLVAVILYAVGGVRLTRVRHRHDVEGAVELVER